MTDELALIAALRRIAPHPAARGLKDDCAVLELGNETMVLTHDVMVAGVHFLPDQDPADIAWKLVATNMSDLAAKGAEPVGVMLAYQFGLDDSRFVEGLGQALAHYGAPLLGGDTTAGKGGQTLGMTAIGRATCQPVPSRSGVKPGDILYVTGPLGAAILGLEALNSGHGDSTAYRRPKALLAEGQALAPFVTAMMDISDGLLLDAMRMAMASGVTLKIDSLNVPIAVPETRRDEALRWGDDYQLLFTASPETKLPVEAFEIGKAHAQRGSPLWLDGKQMSETAHLGYQHRQG